MAQEVSDEWTEFLAAHRPPWRPWQSLWPWLSAFVAGLGVLLVLALHEHAKQDCMVGTALTTSGLCHSRAIDWPFVLLTSLGTLAGTWLSVALLLVGVHTWRRRGRS